ncbi:putative hyalin-like [Apostichopus japonicus]|uniref:Putative hyalin-like n=1 Tax=Stichopus japonicus TaxID=307972 RepID=A0A2G8L865_STIJA|nr:putative hyalin-like [Apostichopus japonicus]
MAGSVSISASPDVDFMNIPLDPHQNVTISAGQTCTPVNVLIISDLNQETMSKDFFLVLYDPSPSSSMVHIVSGHSSTRVTITDDDPDTERPTIHNCPDDITVTAPAGAATTTVSWTPPTATDLSGAVTPTSPQNPGDSFTYGSTQVTYTANDGANNFAFCRFLVSVVDNTPPIISDCPSSTTVFGAVSQDDDSVLISWTEPTATDISGTVNSKASRPGQQFSIGSTTVTYTFTDAAGNSAMCSFAVSVFRKLPSISDPPTEVTRTTTSVTITWRPWNEETDVGDPPVVAYIPYYKMDPSQNWMSGSRIQADQTLEYTASSLETDRNYTFSVAAVREGEGGEGPRGPAVPSRHSVLQPMVQCSTGITQFTIYYEIQGDVFSRQEAGTAGPNAETFTVDGSLLEPGRTYNIAVTVTTDQESALSEGSFLTSS